MARMHARHVCYRATGIALLIVAAAAAPARRLTAADDEATADQLSLDLKHHIHAQLRAGHFDPQVLSNYLKNGYTKLKNSRRQDGTNSTFISDGISVPDFQCAGCLFEEDGFTPRPIVVMYMSDERVCNNIEAVKVLKKQGRSLDACNFEKTAVPECFVAKNWNSGWMCEVMNEIFREMGATVIAKTKANTTVPKSIYSGPSSFTRCVYEVFLNSVDLCVGDFWETAQRRGISSFTTSIDLDSMKLIAMPKGGAAAALGQSPWLPDDSLLWAWATPFSTQVWLVMIGMVCFSALMLCTVEYGYYQYHEPGAKYHQSHWQVPFKLWQATLGILHRPPVRAGTYSDHRHEHVVSWAGRIVLYAYGIFVFFSASNYMAQTMKIYSQGGPAAVVKSSSFASVAQSGGRICMLDALYETVSSKLPNENAFRLDSYGPTVEHLYQGKCDAAIVGKNEYQTYIAQERVSFTVCDNPVDPFGYEQCADERMKPSDIKVIPSSEVCQDEVCDPTMVRRYCPIMVVQDPDFFLDVPFAMPVQDWLNPYISAWITVRKFQGVVRKAHKTYVGGQEANVCNGQYGARPMTMDRVYGIHILSASLMVLGGIFSFVPRFIGWVKERRRVMLGLDPSVHGTIGHTRDLDDVDLYEKSLASGSQYLAYNGPDPGRESMRKKVKDIQHANAHVMTKLTQLAEAQIARENRHAEELEKVRQSAAAGLVPPPVVADAPWPVKAIAGIYGADLHTRSTGAQEQVAI